LLKHGLEAALDDKLELIHGPGCPVCVTPAEAIDAAITEARTGDIVLIAGKGHEQYQEVAGIRHAFSDAVVAREILTQRFVKSAQGVDR
jgi:UDP-N-acetylmuramyl tripeptide synthase